MWLLVETNYWIKKKKGGGEKGITGPMASTLNVCKATSVFAEGLNQRLSFVLECKPPMLV